MKTTKKVAKKLVSNHNRQIARNNKKFEKLSPAEKRVAIARDVLEQIRIKRLIPTAGFWLAGKNNTALFTKADVEKNPEMQTIFANKKECIGCAVGGMFMCAVEMADKLKLDELNQVKNYQSNLANAADSEKKYYKLTTGCIEDEDAFKYLGRFFHLNQLNMIECAFEQGTGAYYNADAAKFAQHEDNPSERMRLIMENIIKNNGVFRYNQEPVIHYSTPGFVR